MNRRALIIGNPGVVGQGGYCEGVLRDLDNYCDFFLSPMGGAWIASEITTLIRPKLLDVESEILKQEKSDYSITIFCGHGHYDTIKKSTYLELQSKTEIDSVKLLSGASKHSLILDCCRVFTNAGVISEKRMMKSALQQMTISPSRARETFDEEVRVCYPGAVVLYGCAVGETAGDNSQLGGLYSSSLLLGAASWSEQGVVRSGKPPSVLSIASAHDVAKPRVAQLTAGRQNPQIEKPRVAKHFPFAVRP